MLRQNTATKRNTPVSQNTTTYKENKMGLQTAIGISELEMPIESQIAIHLRSNFYPPIPLSMVQPCIDAINAYWNDDIYAEIEMPEEVYYRGMTTAPAHAIVEQHRLDVWVTEDEYYEDEEFDV
jgi:hypothetical protein